MKYISHSLEETQKIAVDFANSLLPDKNKATVVGLYGNLGAGKTTLTQYLAKHFGVEDIVTSPTFVIEKIYELKQSAVSSQYQGGIKINQNLNTKYYMLNANFTHLIHIDAYRLEKSEELLHLGWNEMISDKNNLILVEWPERVSSIMSEHIKIKIDHISENEREIEILE